MNTSKMKLLLLIVVFLTGFNAYSQETETPKEKNFGVRTVAEIGFLGVFGHKVQFSNNGTYFDYKKEGGQDVLYPVTRFSVELDIKKRNTIIFLYQPLKIESQVLLRNDLMVDSLNFPAGSSVNTLYNFPFYRTSYLREFLPKSDIYQFAFGATIQIRNTTISFESTDGTRFRTNRNVGIVPTLKMRAGAKLSERVYTQLEADGAYAPISYLNGSDNEVVGAILDASLRTGLKLSDKEPVTAFLNLRYLGGGAVGTSDDNDGPGDGYVKNWLHFTTVTLGFVYEWH